jgi:hypothetical protein
MGQYSARLHWDGYGDEARCPSNVERMLMWSRTKKLIRWDDRGLVEGSACRRCDGAGRA